MRLWHICLFISVFLSLLFLLNFLFSITNHLLCTLVCVCVCVCVWLRVLITLLMLLTDASYSRPWLPFPVNVQPLTKCAGLTLPSPQPIKCLRLTPAGRIKTRPVCTSTATYVTVAPPIWSLDHYCWPIAWCPIMFYILYVLFNTENTHTPTYTYIPTHTPTHTHTPKNAQTHTYTYIHTHTYTHIHTYTYTHIHTHTHTHLIASILRMKAH